MWIRFPRYRFGRRDTPDQRWYIRGAVPDDRWPQVVERVGRVAQRYGFDKHENIQDEPGMHRVRFVDSYGGDLTIGTNKNTSMTITSGCFLLQDARERGAPTETE